MSLSPVRVAPRGARPTEPPQQVWVKPLGAGTDDPRRQKIMATRVGLLFPRNLAFSAWEQAGRKIAGIMDSSAWYLGDWLVYGQDRYPNRYQLAATAAALDYQTLRNYAWVARRFDISRRRSALSFQHHAEVAALAADEQDQWLDRAQEQEWSRNHLRKELRDARRGKTRGRSTTLAIGEVDEERVRLWQEAAARSNLKFEHWIVSTLDSAAAELSGPPTA